MSNLNENENENLKGGNRGAKLTNSDKERLVWQNAPSLR